MKSLKLASYVLVGLIVAVTIYSHLMLRDDPFEQTAPFSNTFSIFNSNATALFGVGMQHRPPARPLVTPWDAAEVGSAESPLDCYNQSTCITPELQVQKIFSIYLCQKVGRHGSRFYYLLSDGLSKHPAVRMVDTIAAADFLFYLPGSAPWHRSECTDTSFADRLIVLDEFDGSFAFSPRKNFEELKQAYPDKVIDKKNVMWYYMYFKRSYVHRKDGKFLRYPFLLKKDFFPMVYSIADSYVRPEYNMERNLLVACTLRGDPKYQPSRLRVLEWLHEYISKHNIPVDKVVTAQVNKASRQTLSSDYFETMYNAEVVVTANPANWEGDFRLWEALASGALVFVDEISTPMPFALVSGKNVVYYSTQNKSDFLSKLNMYLSSKDDRERIAHNGYMHVLRYHRTVNFVDYILRSVHVKLLTSSPVQHSNYTSNEGLCWINYTECGQKLVYELRKKARLD